jgi:hypothetical protein
MPKDDPAPLDLKALAKALNAKGDNLKARRARIDAIVDEDFDRLAAVYQALAK